MLFDGTVEGLCYLLLKLEGLCCLLESRGTVLSFGTVEGLCHS